MLQNDLGGQIWGQRSPQGHNFKMLWFILDFVLFTILITLFRMDIKFINYCTIKTTAWKTLSNNAIY